MVRNHKSAQLRCESLEARDVPAIVINCSIIGSDATPTGGLINVSELELASTTPILNRNLTPGTMQTKSASANDFITFTNAGPRLNITCNDGIFGRVAGTGQIVNYGTSLTVEGAGALSVFLQLGGNDTISDSTTYANTINSGIGNDNIFGAGAFIDPILTPFLFTPTGLNTVALAAIGPTVPPKVLLGGLGNDNITTSGIPTGFIIDGGAGDDTITNSAIGIFNTLRGGDGNDIIVGSLAVDVIEGGIGVDVLVGLGIGDFYFEAEFAPDFIFNQPGDIVIADPFDVVAFV